MSNINGQRVDTIVVGGKVVKSNPAEIGIMDVNFLKYKNNDTLFSKFPEKIKALQWHSYEVRNLENNTDVIILGSSSSTGITVGAAIVAIVKSLSDI